MRAPCWRLSPRRAAASQRRWNAATVRTPHRAVRESGRTTSSLHGLLLPGEQMRLGARGQGKNADEALGVLLVVAVAHGERRQLLGVEREGTGAPGDADVALVERELDRAGHVLLGLQDKAVECLAQRREPQSVVDQVGVLEGDALLEVRDLALQRKRFKLTMRCGDERPS